MHKTHTLGFGQKCLAALIGRDDLLLSNRHELGDYIRIVDEKRLIEDPLVSVRMITYNHGRWIARAIESVMMQRCDFPFELIVSEDCSTDDTLSICKDFQTRYPERIVLLAGRRNERGRCNAARIERETRGRYVAWLEGDDYWTDPMKLQKQLDWIRETGAVMCGANTEWHYPDGHVATDLARSQRCVLTLNDIVRRNFHTSTYVARRDVYEGCLREVFPKILRWYDNALVTCMAAMGPVAFVPDVVSVYNWTGSGAGGAPKSKTRHTLILVQWSELALWGPEHSRALFAKWTVFHLWKNVFCGRLGESVRFTLGERFRAVLLVGWLLAMRIPPRKWYRIIRRMAGLLRQHLRRRS